MSGGKVALDPTEVMEALSNVEGIASEDKEYEDLKCKVTKCAHPSDTKNNQVNPNIQGQTTKTDNTISSNAYTNYNNNMANNANQAVSSNQIFSPNIISSGGGGCRSCVTVKSQTDVRKIANQLAVDVYKSLTTKINKNKAKASKK